MLLTRKEATRASQAMKHVTWYKSLNGILTSWAQASIGHPHSLATSLNFPQQFRTVIYQISHFCRVIYSQFLHEGFYKQAIHYSSFCGLKHERPSEKNEDFCQTILFYFLFKKTFFLSIIAYHLDFVILLSFEEKSDYHSFSANHSSLINLTFL